jgi:hypothetical protein
MLTKSNFVEYPLHFIQYDTFPGFSFQINIGTKDAPVYQSMVGASAEMQIRAAPGSPVLMDIKSDDGYITFPNPTLGIVQVGPFKANLPVSPIPYVYDIPVTFSSGSVTTYIGGQVFVRPKTTHT